MDKAFKILIIFDIDGTLIDSMDFDSECYIKAISEVLKINNINSDWSIYKKISDSGIFEEIYKNNFKKNTEDINFRMHERTFYNIFKKKLDYNNILEIPGTQQIINQIKILQNYFIAIATGTYKKTALLKLNQININENDFPLSTANDDKSREKIIQKCIKKSKYFYNIDKFDKIVSIGDGIWDLRTAINLSLPFIGIGKNKFKKISNCISLDNYKNEIIFFDSIKESFIPNLFKL